MDKQVQSSGIKNLNGFPHSISTISDAFKAQNIKMQELQSLIDLDSKNDQVTTSCR